MISKIEIEKIGKQIVHSAYEVHKELGPGLLESVYEICLVDELRNCNLCVERQVKLPVFYKGKQLQKDFFTFFSEKHNKFHFSLTQNT